MDHDLTRRQLLAGAVGGGAALTGGGAVYNALLGYDRVTGTNLQRQDLDPLVAERLAASGEIETELEDHRLEQSNDRLSVVDRDTGEVRASLERPETSPAEAAAVDAEFDLAGGPLEQLVADLGGLESGDVRFVYDHYSAFFERIAAGESRPYTVAALRGSRSVEPEIVERFAGADPREPGAVVSGLVDAFREHTRYDAPRYVAGSVQDNVLLGTRDLRARFESDTSFEAMLEGRDTGLFCNELTRRSVEALQAVPADAQSTPVLGGFVSDDRHKHVYTTLASALREDGELVVPVAFLDYKYSTLAGDLRLDGLGEGLDAYDRYHRATLIRWYA